MDVADDIAQKTISRLRSAAEPDRTHVSDWYFPSSMESIGMSAPTLKSIEKEIDQELRNYKGDERTMLARRLVESNILEARQVAYLLLSRKEEYIMSLTISDLRALMKGVDNWVSVDTFATMVSGVAWRLGVITDEQVAKWATSKDLWTRRTALVSTVALNTKSRGGTGDVDRTLLICRMLADDHEDMIVKALSWALRSLGSRIPDPVRKFLDEYQDVLHKRVIREVNRKLDTGRKN